MTRRETGRQDKTLLRTAAFGGHRVGLTGGVAAVISVYPTPLGSIMAG